MVLLPKQLEDLFRTNDVYMLDISGLVLFSPRILYEILTEMLKFQFDCLMRVLNYPVYDLSLRLKRIHVVTVGKRFFFLIWRKLIIERQKTYRFIWKC